MIYLEALVFELDIAILFQSMKILKKWMDRITKMATALSLIDPFEKFLLVQVRINLVYHLSNNNKLPTTFSFRVRYSNSVSVYENPQKRVEKKYHKNGNCSFVSRPIRKISFCTSPNLSFLTFLIS